MATDEDGDLDFSAEPGAAYTIPGDHLYLVGVRVWKTLAPDGKVQIFWHLDDPGDSRTFEFVGLLEMAKLAIADQQLTEWRDDG